MPDEGHRYLETVFGDYSDVDASEPAVLDVEIAQRINVHDQRNVWFMASWGRRSLSMVRLRTGSAQPAPGQGGT